MWAQQGAGLRKVVVGMERKAGRRGGAGRGGEEAEGGICELW